MMHEAYVADENEGVMIMETIATNRLILSQRQGYLY
jgi:hypothetical protein